MHVCVCESACACARVCTCACMFACTDVYGFFPSQRSAFDISHEGAVGYGDMSYIPLQDDPRQPRESSTYRPRNLYEMHSLMLEHYVLEYLEDSGAVRWHTHDSSDDAKAPA